MIVKFCQTSLSTGYDIFEQGHFLFQKLGGCFVKQFIFGKVQHFLVDLTPFPSPIPVDLFR